MFKKRKIKKWFEQGKHSLEAKDYQQAVYFFKLVIEASIKNGGIQLNECFNAFISLGDIYNEELCFEEADKLYRMAAGMDFSAKFVLLKEELFHDDSKYNLDRKKWLKKNMIDFTDIIQANDGKKWIFLIEEGKTRQPKLIPTKKRKPPVPIDEESFWSYEDYLDTQNI